MHRSRHDRDLRLFGEIVAKLEHVGPDRSARQVILCDIMKLLDADFAVSYCWSPISHSFADPYSVNVEADHLTRYQQTYQFVDPITAKLRKLGRATIVTSVINESEFRKTEFYNDFLKSDGLHHGINLYIFDGKKDLGDFRIWRARDRASFDEWEAMLLDALEPHLRRAIMRTDFTFPELTDRERDVAALVARGLTDREIANTLKISFSTVRTHLNRVLEKLGCASRVELAGLMAGFRH